MRLQVTSQSPRMAPRIQLRVSYKKLPIVTSTPAQTPIESVIDAFIEDVIRAFDLSPILFGDRLQARFVAIDLWRELVSRAAQAEEEGAPFTAQEVVARLQVRWPGMTQSQLVFRRSMDSQVATA